MTTTNREIKIVLRDETEQCNTAKIVLFQENALAHEVGPPIAWRVAGNPIDNRKVSFMVSNDFEIAVRGADGNVTGRKPARYGDRWEVVEGPKGTVLRKSGEATSADRVELTNGLPKGAVDALLFRRSGLQTEQNALLPGQVAAFSFAPKIFLHRVSEAEEGHSFQPAVFQDEPLEIDYDGADGAEVVMRGGGRGPDAQPIEFSVEQVHTG